MRGELREGVLASLSSVQGLNPKGWGPSQVFSALLPGDAQGWRGKGSYSASTKQGKGKSDGNGEGRCETARDTVRFGKASQDSVVD